MEMNVVYADWTLFIEVTQDQSEFYTNSRNLSRSNLLVTKLTLLMRVLLSKQSATGRWSVILVHIINAEGGWRRFEKAWSVSVPKLLSVQWIGREIKHSKLITLETAYKLSYMWRRAIKEINVDVTHDDNGFFSFERESRIMTSSSQKVGIGVCGYR